MADASLGLTLPLRVSVSGESVEILDAAGVMAAHFYFSQVLEHGHSVKRVQQEQAVELAKIAARAITKALGGA